MIDARTSGWNRALIDARLTDIANTARSTKKEIFVAHDESGCGIDPTKNWNHRKPGDSRLQIEAEEHIVI